MRRLARWSCFLLAWPAPGLADHPAQGWDSSRLSMPVVVDQHTIPYPEFAFYAMPEQTLQVSFGDATEGGTLRFRGHTAAVGSAITAPREPGLSRLVIEHPASGEVAVINVFTQVPASRIDGKGYLNGYRMGRYPQKALRGLDIYRPPGGFVEVTAENADTRVSPNFRLGQFVSKQDQGYPKYLVLHANLLLKLEQILAALNQRGRATSSLVIMSGYRTPWYNQAIGNVPYSRHVWGGAADVYIDESPADGQLDDLNGDGRIDRADADWLAAFVDEMSRRGDFGPRVGGLGIYDSNAVHGPFIHVDVRGFEVHW